MKESEVYIYGEISSNPMSNGISADMVRSQIDPTSEVINVHISSPGGEVYEGYAIYNALKGSGKTINVSIEGLCASMATVIAMSGDHITISPLAEFMIHNPLVGIQGDEHDLRSAAEQLSQMKDTIISVYKKRTGLEEKALSRLMDDETYMTPEKALEFGFVDEIKATLRAVAYIDPKKIKSMDNTQVQEKMNWLESQFKNLEAMLTKLFPAKNFEATLKDGTCVYIDGECIESGKSIYSEDKGNRVALSDGEHILSDETKLKVSGGKIESVTKIVEQPVDYKAQFEAATNQLTELSKERDELKSSLKEKEDTLNNLSKEVNTIKTELTSFKAFVPQGSTQGVPLAPIPDAKPTEQLSLFAKNLQDKLRQRQ